MRKRDEIWCCAFPFLPPFSARHIDFLFSRDTMEGFDAVIFAYGQTASGKTFTLVPSLPSPPLSRIQGLTFSCRSLATTPTPVSSLKLFPTSSATFAKYAPFPDLCSDRR